MIQPLHESYLSSNTFFPLNIFNFLFLIYFECNFFVKFFMHTNSYNSISSLTYLFTYNVITQAMFFRVNYFL